MTTPNNPEDKVITPEAPKDETVGVVESTRKNLVLQKLLSLVKGMGEVCETSESTEARLIPEDEIIRVILGSCDLHKLNLEGLEITKVTRNEQGAVVVLEAKTLEKDGGYSQFGFTKEGKHKRVNSKAATATKITNVSRDIFDKDGDFTDGETVAEHKDGVWSHEGAPFDLPNVGEGRQDKEWILKNKAGEVITTAKTVDGELAIVTDEKAK